MLKNFLSTMTLFVVLTMLGVASAEEYDWDKMYDFPCRRLVRCVNDSGEWDHSVYYFADKNNRCLVVICHGFYNNEGYGIIINNQWRHDYAQAVSESLAYWSRQGKLQCGPYDYVFMNTCFSGYANKNTWLPTFNVNLRMAIDYKGVTGFIEHYDRNGNVNRLSIYKCKLLQTPVGSPVSAINGLKNPPGLQIL